ncbi:MAG: phenylacetate--CoA ligase family protein [Bacillota bacterium]
MKVKIWNPVYECMPRREIEALQLMRLREQMDYAYRNVPLYREKFDKAGLTPCIIRSLQDLPKIPFTDKNDFRLNYPYGMFAVPLEKIVRIHSSSGTTGTPTVVGYTKEDLDTWSELVARFITAAGVTASDIVQICFGYGLFTGGFGLHYGLEKVGATVIPVSSGNTERQIKIMKDFGSTVLVSTPSYALHMAEVAKEMGILPGDLKLRVGLFGAEPWSEAMRRELEKAWGMLATDNYGLSEVMGPGVAGECIFCCGQHLQEDHFIPEIIDPETGENLPPGKEGELVLTVLTKKAQPVFRYRTRDLTVLNYESCRCGRTNVRMRKTTGRTDDMLIIRGVNVFPSQIEEILIGIEGVTPQYQLVVERVERLDTLEVDVEVDAAHFTGRLGSLEMLADQIRQKIFTALNIHVKVRLLEPKSIERSLGKAKRVIDKREIN